MKLRKSQHEIPKVFGGGFEDCLVGVYTHKKSGVIIADCTNQFWDNKDGAYLPIWIMSPKDNRNWLYLSIKDYNSKNGKGEPKIMGGDSRLYFHPQSPKTIRMILTDEGYERVYLDEGDVYPTGTTLPTDVILTKIE